MNAEVFTVLEFLGKEALFQEVFKQYKFAGDIPVPVGDTDVGLFMDIYNAFNGLPKEVTQYALVEMFNRTNEITNTFLRTVVCVHMLLVSQKQYSWDVFFEFYQNMKPKNDPVATFKLGETLTSVTVIGIKDMAADIQKLINKNSAEKEFIEIKPTDLNVRLFDTFFKQFFPVFYEEAHEKILNKCVDPQFAADYDRFIKAFEHVFGFNKNELVLNAKIKKLDDLEKHIASSLESLKQIKNSDQEAACILLTDKLNWALNLAKNDIRAISKDMDALQISIINLKQ